MLKIELNDMQALQRLPKRRKINAAEQGLVAALSGGAFRQGTGALHPSRGKYCCLGVACKISGRGRFRGNGFFDSATKIEDVHSLSAGVMKWLGWLGHTGLLRSVGVVVPTNSNNETLCSSLAGINDAGGTFAFIAGLVRKGYVETISY